MPAYIVAHIYVKDPIRYEDYKRLVLDTMTPSTLVLLEGVARS